MAIRTFRSLPTGIKMVNLCPTAAQIAATPDPYKAWAVFWQSNIASRCAQIKAEIDLIAATGANAVRGITDPTYGVFSGRYTLEQLCNAHDDVILYARSKGLMWDPSPGGPADGYLDHGGFQGYADNIATLARRVSVHPNVWGMDVMQEFYYAVDVAFDKTLNQAISDSQMQSLMSMIIAGCHVAAPDLAFTASFHRFNDQTTFWTDAKISEFASMFDYIDFHLYHDPSPGESQALYQQAGTSGKPFLVGETGQVISAGPTARLSRLTSVYQNIVRATYPGQPGCHGFGWWAVLDHGTDDSSDYGLFGADGSIRDGVEAAFAAIPANPWSAANIHRRRRAS